MVTSNPCFCGTWADTGFANVLCFPWYLSRYQGILAVPLKGWSVNFLPVRSTERDTCPDSWRRVRQRNAISGASPILFGNGPMPCRHRGKREAQMVQLHETRSTESGSIRSLSRVRLDPAIL